jgi:RNA polymerase sigma factor (sigma-70 family)
MQDTDDIELLRRYADDNSEEAFATVVTRHLNLVYSVALRHVQNTHHAEEITQAVFVILARKAKGLRQRTVLSGWLYHAARLTAANFLRSEIQRGRREQEAHMRSLLNESESDIWPQLAPLLDAAMARLGEKDRNAVVLRFFESKAMSDVGATLGISEEAAKKKVSRAVEKLRQFFTKRGVVVPAAVLMAAISANSVQAAPAVLAKTATAVAFTKGTMASISTLTLIKGALKVMAWSKAKTAVVTGIVLLLVGGSTAVVVVEAQSGKGPIGSLVEKKRQKDALIAQVESMRSVFDAIIEYARVHQDELPKSLMELKPFLPANLTGMDDQDWEMPVRGKITSVMKRPNLNTLVLMQQKNIPPDKARIIMYMDGSITYKK